MFSSSGKSNGASIRVDVDPDPGQIGKDVERYVTRPMGSTMAGMHRQLSDVPVSEIRRRSQRMGSGRVRIGRALAPSSDRGGFTIDAGAGFPDFAGQEYGSNRWPQFLPFNRDGYVIGAMMSDTGFTDGLLDKYVDGLSELLEDVWNQ